jgi:NTP pyrophosphatase (non-canonical NTP hydrolase)
MTIRDWQLYVQNSAPATSSATEIMLAVTEEIGEVAQEVALIERIGSKAHWQKAGSAERLGEEISHALNCLVALAHHYRIDLETHLKP